MSRDLHKLRRTTVMAANFKAEVTLIMHIFHEIPGDLWKLVGRWQNNSMKPLWNFAKQYLRKALPIFIEFLGETRENNACYRVIGHVLFGKDQYEEELVEIRKALVVFRDVVGENHNFTANCYEDIGLAFLATMEFDDAFIFCGKTLSIRVRVLGENHIDTTSSHHNSGNLLARKGQGDEALISLRKAHEIRKLQLGEGHARTVVTKQKIDRALRQKDKKDNGDYYYTLSSALAIFF